MKKMLSAIMSVLLTLCVMTALTACGSTSTSSSSKQGGTAGPSASSSNAPIKIGFSALPSWYLWYLIDDLGFFKKHGVNVQLVWFPVYADSLQALDTGKIDADSAALMDTISPLANGIPLKTVFITDNSAGGDGLVASDSIKSVKDLKGKKIGTEIGTIEQFFMETALKDNGLKDSDVQFTNMAVPDAGNALIAGKLDAAGLWEPFLSKAVTKNTHKLVTSADYPGMIADVLAVRQSVDQQRSAELQKVVDAWYDGLNYLQTHHDQAVAIMAKKAGISKQEIEVGLQGFKLFTPQDNMNAFKQGNNFSSFYYTATKNAEFLKSLGYIQSVPDFSNFVDTKYLKNVIKSESK